MILLIKSKIFKISFKGYTGILKETKVKEPEKYG